jgi:hypothetical protein
MVAVRARQIGPSGTLTLRALARPIDGTGRRSGATDRSSQGDPARRLGSVTRRSAPSEIGSSALDDQGLGGWRVSPRIHLLNQRHPPLCRRLHERPTLASPTFHFNPAHQPRPGVSRGLAHAYRVPVLLAKVAALWHFERLRPAVPVLATQSVTAWCPTSLTLGASAIWGSMTR